MITILTSVLAGACLLAVPRGARPFQDGEARSDVQARDLDAVRTSVERLSKELVELGYAFDIEAFELELLSLAACADDLNLQQDDFFLPGHFEAMWHVFDALGIAPGPDGRTFRKIASHAMAETFLAYYGFHRDTLVFVESSMGRLGRNDHLLLHELSHAWRDQRLDLAEFFRSGQRTFERIRLKQCVVEGEAEAIALHAQAAREGRELERSDRLDDDQAAKFLAGQGIASIYSVGRRYVRSRWDGTVATLDALYGALPASTEQLLHPEKLGADEPVDVALIDWPEEWGAAELVHEDTLGELGILGILSESGLDETTCSRLAAGWDGDRLRLWRPEDGADLLVWRLAFDREVDAQQFLAPWTRSRKTVASQVGRVVCLARGKDRARVRTAHERLTALTAPPTNAGDAASTEAIEAALAETPTEPYLDEGLWILPEHGLALTGPVGWKPELMRGTPFLMGPAKDGFRDNLNLSVFPDPSGAGVEAILATNRAFFEQNEGLRLHTSDVRTVGGTEVVYLTYGGPFDGRQLEFRVLILPREEHQLVLTATVLASRSQEVAPLADAALLSLELR